MSQHKEFIAAYAQMYEQHFGGPYLFQGGKDGSAVKRLMANHVPISEAMAILKDSFTRTGYPWDRTVTIAGFVSVWPVLVAERAKRANPNIKKPVTRWDLQRQIEYVKEQISHHPHNPESIYEDRNAVTDVSLEQWRKKLEELKKQYAAL